MEAIFSMEKIRDGQRLNKHGAGSRKGNGLGRKVGGRVKTAIRETR